MNFYHKQSNNTYRLDTPESLLMKELMDILCPTIKILVLKSKVLLSEVHRSNDLESIEGLLASKLLLPVEDLLKTSYIILS